MFNNLSQKTTLKNGFKLGTEMATNYLITYLKSPLNSDPVSSISCQKTPLYQIATFSVGASNKGMKNIKELHSHFNESNYVKIGRTNQF